MQEEITSQLSRQMLLFHRLYSEKISRRFRALHMDATSQAEFLLMAIVTEHGEIPMSELCDRAMMLKQQVTRLVNQLEEKGLVQRLSVEQDARLKKLILTEKSAMLGEKMRIVGEQADARLMEGFTKEEQNQLYAFIDRMVENMSRE